MSVMIMMMILYQLNLQLKQIWEIIDVALLKDNISYNFDKGR